MAEMQDERKQTESAEAAAAAEADAFVEEDAKEAAEVQGAEPAQNGESGEDPRVAELAKQAEENYNRYLRAQADFDNYRRRTQKEKEELAQYASMKLVSALLPVLDNFERAFQAVSEAEESNSFMKGMDMIYRQFQQVLEAEGLRKMEPVGTPFDPELHQAIMQVESEEYGEGIVVEVVQNGYFLKEKVLRPAMVKVSS